MFKNKLRKQRSRGHHSRFHENEGRKLPGEPGSGCGFPTVLSRADGLSPWLLPPFLIRAAEDGTWLPSPYAVNAPASPKPVCCQCQHRDTRGPTAPNSQSLKGKAQPLKLGARRGPGLLWGVSAGKVRGCTKLGGGATSPVVVSHHWEVTFRGTRVPSLGGASGPWGSSPC